MDKVRFRFMPPAFVSRTDRQAMEDPDFGRLESVYAFCYEWVFEGKPLGNIKKHRDLIVARVLEAKTSLKLFLLANMLGWKHSHEGNFYPQVLTTDFAVHQVNTFAEACNHRFGVFDTTTLDRLMGSNVAMQDFEAHILNSEIVFGSWMINYKLFHTGNIMPTFYREKETALNPYWLAIEPTYYDLILGPHLDNPEACPSDLIRRQRWNTMKIIGTLKKASQKAIAVFGAREHIMPEAIRAVLAQRGLLPEHFQTETAPVTHSIKFWSRLGSAVQQYECLKFVDNCPSVFDRHFVRTNSVLS